MHRWDGRGRPREPSLWTVGPTDERQRALVLGFGGVGMAHGADLRPGDSMADKLFSRNMDV